MTMVIDNDDDDTATNTTDDDDDNNSGDDNDSDDVSCACVSASVCVCICHSRDSKKIFLVSKDKNESGEFSWVSPPGNHRLCGPMLRLQP